MKAFRILIATVVLSALTLTSCSKDDDNVQVPTSIVGKWNFAKEVTQTNIGTAQGPEIVIDYTLDVAGCSKNYLEFTATQIARKVVSFKNAQNICEESANNGSYVKVNDSININLPSVDQNLEKYHGAFKIVKLTSNELYLEKRIVDGDVTVIGTRLLTKAAN